MTSMAPSLTERFDNKPAMSAASISASAPSQRLGTPLTETRKAGPVVNLFPGGPSALNVPVPAREKGTIPILFPALSFTTPPPPQTSGGKTDGATTSRPVRVHDEALHDQLNDRIVRIRVQRQGRWRKFLSILPGSTRRKTAT